MPNVPPKVVVLAGPNGAGKSTSAAKLLLGVLKVQEFVNADTIAQGLSAFAQDRVALQAGRIMLARLKELAKARASFGFETTLANRSYARWLSELRAAGYKVHIVFLWLPRPMKRSPGLPNASVPVGMTYRNQRSAGVTKPA